MGCWSLWTRLTWPLAERTKPLLAVTMSRRCWSAVPKMTRLRWLMLADSGRSSTHCDGPSSKTLSRAISSAARSFSPGPPSVSTRSLKLSTACRHVINLQRIVS